MSEELIAQALAPFLHRAQLANAVTGFATCLAGIMPLLWTAMIGGQPRRWTFVYGCIVLTGIPTVWFHAYEENTTAAAFDVASNIFLVWAMQIGVAGDFMTPRKRNIFLGIVTLLNALAFAWIFSEIGAESKLKLIDFGAWGFFYVGEVALILNSFLVTGIFFAHLRRIPPVARPLLYTVFILFFAGMLLATADNSLVLGRIFALHALWHLIGAFALTTLWLFNHVRFQIGEPDHARP